MDFDTKLKNAEFWFVQALQMLEASKYLFSAVSLSNPSPLLQVGAHKGSAFLLGIAVENAFKGILAFRSELIVEGDRLKTQNSFKKGSPHDLMALSKLLNINFLKEELELFKRLSVYTTWAGKYGTPLRKSDFTKDQDFLFQKDADFDTIEKLIFKLRTQAGFDELKGWPSLRS